MSNRPYPSHPSDQTHSHEDAKEAIIDGINNTLNALVADPSLFMKDLIEAYFNGLVESAQESNAISNDDINKINKLIWSILSKTKIVVMK
jgi:hypothetical protein